MFDSRTSLLWSSVEMDQSKQFTAKQLWDKVAATPQKTTVLVTGQYSSHFRSLPSDGRVYIIQDPRRPWVHHVTHANGAYTRIDDKNPRIHVTVRLIRNGKKHSLQNKYAQKPKQRQIEECIPTATELSAGELPIQMIDLKRVMQITSFRKSFIYEQMGIDFPMPIRLGNSRRSAARWVQSEVVAWVNALIAKRTATSTNK
jgi:predicted DNA-binding transcriptional regulator AlpA